MEHTIKLNSKMNKSILLSIPLFVLCGCSQEFLDDLNRSANSNPPRRIQQPSLQNAGDVLNYARQVNNALEDRSRAAFAQSGLNYDAIQQRRQEYYNHYIQQGVSPEKADEYATDAVAREIFR